ncbi:unnamed protein product [Parascedosporium putredinis]|uniref:Uncharacterized protein n=1 Tax=Parascedosporium putredinis TaxID=1442378 RepID=A0A9P1H073_9PEZI|nr:unnamed protein product [Parascedosporium putredinis]CAI7993610.1 unnamed protein product [Parascedosporium putredinis]
MREGKRAAPDGVPAPRFFKEDAISHRRQYHHVRHGTSTPPRNEDVVLCVFLLCAVVLIKLISSTATTGFLTAERPRVPLGIFSLSSLGNTDPEAAAALRPDIRADTNRDGVVDITSTSHDSATKAIWTARRGAIFLPNVGDKYYRCRTHDAVGNP